MELSLVIDIDSICTYLLSLKPTKFNNHSLKLNEFIYHIYDNYKIISPTTNQFKLIKEVIDYYKSKSKEVYLISKYKEYIEINYTTSEYSGIFISLIKSLLYGPNETHQTEFINIYNIIKTNIIHLKSNVSTCIEIIKEIIKFSDISNNDGFGNFCNLFSIITLLYNISNDELVDNNLMESFIKSIISIQCKIHSSLLLNKIEFKQCSNNGNGEMVSFTSQFQKQFKILIDLKYIKFYLTNVLSSEFGVGQFYYGQFILSYLSLVKVLCVHYKQLIIECIGKEFEIGLINYKPLLSSLIDYSIFDYQNYKNMVNSLISKKSYEFTKFFTLVYSSGGIKSVSLDTCLPIFKELVDNNFQNIKFQTILSFFIYNLYSKSCNSITSIFKIKQVQLLGHTNDKITNQECDHLKAIYRFSFQKLKENHPIELFIDSLLFGSQIDFKIKFEFIQNEIFNHLLILLDSTLIIKHLLPKVSLSHCNQFELFKSKVYLTLDTSSSSSSSTVQLPNYLIQNIYFIILNNESTSQYCKLQLSMVSKRYFQYTRKVMNNSTTIPIILYYFNFNIKKKKNSLALNTSNGNNGSTGWCLVNENEILYLKFRIQREKEYLNFEYFKLLFTSLEKLDLTIENGIKPIKSNSLISLSQIQSLKYLKLTLNQIRISKPIWEEIKSIPTTKPQLEIIINLTNQSNESNDSMYSFDKNKLTLDNFLIDFKKQQQQSLTSSVGNGIKIGNIQLTFKQFLSFFNNKYYGISNCFTLNISSDYFQFNDDFTESDIQQFSNQYNCNENVKTIKSLEFILDNEIHLDYIFKLVVGMSNLQSIKFKFSTIITKEFESSITLIFKSLLIQPNSNNLTNLKSIKISDEFGYPINQNWSNINYNQYWNTVNFIDFYKID